MEGGEKGEGGAKRGGGGGGGHRKKTRSGVGRRPGLMSEKITPDRNDELTVRATRSELAAEKLL